MTDKPYRSGARRACSPEVTWARIAPRLPVFGVTRVANLTGLDRIGIPVFQACRPNARSLSVYQGKGPTRDAARVSAVMEAIETHCAETIMAPLKFASIEELRFTHHLADIDQLPLTEVEGIDPDLPFLWMEGHDLIGGNDRWTPFEMVHANYALPEPAHSGALAATTNGLASGNTRDEAVLHALLEVVERDAETLWKLGGGAWGDATAVRLDTIDDPVCRALLDQFAAAGMDVAVWDVTSDIGAPTFLALIDDREGRDGAPEFGAGCHLAPEVALSRALTEAAQARLTYIAGAREDIPDHDYGHDIVAARREEARRLLDGLSPQRPFSALENREAETTAGDVEVVVEMLMSVGLTQAIAFDLDQPAFGVPVVRIVVPGLEAAVEGPDADYIPGARAVAMFAENDA